MTPSTNSSAEKVSAWLEDRFSGAKLELLRDNPWARTTKVVHEKKTYYLKEVRGDGSKKVRAAQQIAKAFAPQVPPVLAANPALAAMVVADHGGKSIKQSSRSELRSKVLACYAQLQVKAARQPFDASLMPEFNAETLVSDFLDFLNPAFQHQGKNIGVSHYIGETEAKRYLKIFEHVKAELLVHTGLATKLPKTINHCDLRPANMALMPDGSISIYDWDDAIRAPSGLSLHAQFSGCIRPHLALMDGVEKSSNKQLMKDRQELNCYILPFVEAGLVSAKDMRYHLSSAIVSGVLYHILTFGQFGEVDNSTRRSVAATIEKRLNSVLDVCECLIARDDKKLKALGDVYFRSGSETRLEDLEGRVGRSLVDLPNLNKNAVADSRKTGTVPGLEFSDAERDAGVCLKRNAKLGSQLYTEHGVLALRNAFPKELIEECREHFLGRYEEYFQNKRHKDALRVGNQRFMITLGMEGPINRPSVYAPPTIMPIIERLLGKNHILGSMVAVASLPGSKDQSLHRDHKALFPEASFRHPPFAISVMIPLIDMVKEVGVTRLYKGTHVMSSEEGRKMPYQDPEMPVGSCFLMDYRVYHRGMGNRSDRVRPVMTLIFQRPWFRDYVNYEKQVPLIIPEGERERVPSEHRHLIDWM